MDAKTKVKWLAALRSGEFQQARNMLTRPDGSMCCLAVLAHVCGKDPQAVRYDEDTGLLDEKFTQPLGLSYEEQADLAERNDGGETFIGIADYIEEWL